MAMGVFVKPTALRRRTAAALNLCIPTLHSPTKIWNHVDWVNWDIWEIRACL